MDRTPSNPSRRAIARVKDPVPAPTECRYCAGEVKVAHHDEVYGRAYGSWPWLYRCSDCDARVGMHPFTDIPLGTLADAALRARRTEVKRLFQATCEEWRWDRSTGYAYLALALHTAPKDTHFGLFEDEQLDKVQAWLLSLDAR